MADSHLQEDEVKRLLCDWLRHSGWSVERVAMGNAPGIDIEASRAGDAWRIEVKGIGSRPQMRHNFFLAALGEIMQRMDDPATSYSVAFPEHTKFRKLWNQLPNEAKHRTGISALFVQEDGNVSQEW